MEKYKERHEDALSIVIPTYNRPNDLKDLLLSILRQTKLPKEVIVVDDSENLRTRDLIEEIRKYFSQKRILLKYLHNPTRSSSSAARNQGTMHTTGEIILFLDDDVVLEKEYIEENLKIYRNYPNAIGVQGYLTSTPQLENFSLKLRNLLHKIFFLFHFEKDRCRVLPSGGNTYPSQVSRVIECQWMDGCNQSFKSEVLKDEKFDENLTWYSFLEDVELSYRLFKKYPNSLYMTPYAKVFHRSSKVQRIPIDLLTCIQTINRTYFFYKHIRQTPLNKLIFIWSNVGQIVFMSLILVARVVLLKRPRMFEIRQIKILWTSYLYTLKHLQEIKLGNLKFVDSMFLPGK